jgi:two-component system, NtrC family, nitrogen regulation sensor histidine kinase NtrY
MLNYFKNLEIEWKIILIATISLFALAFPLQSIYINKLKSTLAQSIDPQLETLLRSLISTQSDSSKNAIGASLERNRQWQALIPYIIEEQSFAMILISSGLFITLLLFSFWSLKRLTRPLKDLATAADFIGKGKDIVIIPKEGGALGKLERSMLSMQSELIKLREKAHTQGMESAWRDIARVMAHEIKNPLTPIQLTLDRIQDRFDRDSDLTKDEIIKFVNRISTQVNNLERLVNDFRSFAKEPEPIISSIFLEDTIATITNETTDFILTTLTGDATILADPHLLHRVFLNIWKNSFEAGATKITAIIEKSLAFVTLTISDNGPGIDTEKLDKVWIPYVTFKKGGTGLGLPVVKRLLESMNATIELTSSTNEKIHGVTMKIVFLSIHSQTPSDTYFVGDSAERIN